jgi:hypothetical protein
MTTVIAILCLAGAAFCVRFMVALSNDSKARGPATKLKRHENGLDMDYSLGLLDDTD